MAKYVEFHPQIYVKYRSKYYYITVHDNEPFAVALCCRTLGIPVSDYTYDDCRLMTKAKRMNLPFASGLIEVQKLRQKLGYVSFCINVE